MGQRIVIDPLQRIESRVRGNAEFPSPQSHPAQADMRMRVIGIDRQRPFVDLLRVAPAAQAQIQIGGLQKQARPHQVRLRHPFERGQRFRIALLRRQYLRFQVIDHRRLVARQITPACELAPLVAVEIVIVEQRLGLVLRIVPPRARNASIFVCASSNSARRRPSRSSTMRRISSCIPSAWQETNSRTAKRCSSGSAA